MNSPNIPILILLLAMGGVVIFILFFFLLEPMDDSNTNLTDLQNDFDKLSPSDGINSINVEALAKAIVDRFTLRELKILGMQRLNGLNIETLPHETLDELATELIWYMQRRGRLAELIIVLMNERKQKCWLGIINR